MYLIEALRGLRTPGCWLRSQHPREKQAIEEGTVKADR